MEYQSSALSSIRFTLGLHSLLDGVLICQRVATSNHSPRLPLTAYTATDARVPTVNTSHRSRPLLTEGITRMP
jgi:hypothetical protein